MGDDVSTAAGVPAAARRNQAEAWRVARKAYPYECCTVCGLQMQLQIAHLDQDAGNNESENLAYLCPTHHGMVDSGLYPLDAIKQMRAWWQETRGRPDHSGRMKDAGKKAAATRASNEGAKARSSIARKAVATRRANAKPPLS